MSIAVPVAGLTTHARMHVCRQTTWIQQSPLPYQAYLSESLRAALAIDSLGSFCPLCR